MKDTLILGNILNLIFIAGAKSPSRGCYSDSNGNEYCAKQDNDDYLSVFILGGFTELNYFADNNNKIEAVHFSSEPGPECPYLPDLPEPRDGALAFFHDVNYLSLCGGLGHDYTGKCWKFDGKGRMDLGDKIAPRRFSSSVTTHHQKTYILGGETRHYVLKTLELLSGPDLKSTARKSLMYGISRHCMVQIGDNNLMAIGGRLLAGKQIDFSNKVFSYSINDNLWKESAKMRQGRQFHSCAIIDVDENPKIVVVGGRNYDILNTVEIFDSKKQVWDQGESLDIPIYMSALIPDRSGGAILFGGQSQTTMLNKIYQFSKANGKFKWKTLGQKMVDPRRCHSVVVVPQSFCQEHWKLMFIGAKEGQTDWANSSLVFDLSTDMKICDPLPDYPIPPVGLAGSFDENGNPFFCGNATQCYRLKNGQWEEGPSLKDAYMDRFMTRLYSGLQSFLWLGTSWSGSTETLHTGDFEWKESISLPNDWTDRACQVQINQDKILVISSNKNESRILIVSQMKLIQGPSHQISRPQEIKCATIRTKKRSFERSVIKMVMFTDEIEFLDIKNGDVNAQMKWRVGIQKKGFCHSELVETPDGGVVIVSGHKRQLLKLDNSESKNWTLLDQKLPFNSTDFATLMVPDRFVDCH